MQEAESVPKQPFTQHRFDDWQKEKKGTKSIIIPVNIWNVLPRLKILLLLILVFYEYLHQNPDYAKSKK